jgi:quinone-modifying oxidoreductase, subunit QmoC
MSVPATNEMMASFRNIHGGQRVDSCIQCGTCSGSCPLAAEMDFGPRGLFALIRAGDLEPALRSNTLWLCVSCQACTVRCPQEIPVTELIHALKQLALEHGLAPRGQKMPDLYQAFAAQVRSRGRASETMIAARYGLRHPGDMIDKISLALELLKRKRMSL